MEATFVAKAAENLREAEILFDQELYNASANRAYYAAFHAAVAALARNGIRFERLDHEKIQAKFSGELIRRRKLFPGRFRSRLLDLQAVRNDADYRRKLIAKKVARRQLDKSREYVESLQEVT